LYVGELFAAFCTRSADDVLILITYFDISTTVVGSILAISPKFVIIVAGRYIFEDNVIIVCRVLFFYWQSRCAVNESNCKRIEA